MAQRGAIAVALVDYTSGMSLATAGGGSFDLELAAAGHSEAMRGKVKAVEASKVKAKVEDVLITLSDQYHLLRILPNEKHLFLYYVLKRAEASLALARHKLAEAGDQIGI
jgi:hypothetical protein